MIVWSMLTLALAATPRDGAVPPDPSAASMSPDTPQVRLASFVTWGIGGQMYLGAQVGAAGEIPVVRTRGADLRVDVGGHVSYGNEAVFLAPWIDASTTRGATHRVQAVASAGVSLHLGPQRRVDVGLAAYVGANHWRSAYTVDDPASGVVGSAVVARWMPVVGGAVTVSGRVSERVGIAATVQAPVQRPSSYAVGLVGIGVGPVFWLR